MASTNPNNNSERLELKFVGHSLNTLGVFALSVALGILSVMMDNIPAGWRTGGGIAVALCLGLIAEGMSRRKKETKFSNWWVASNLNVAAYSLAWFFVWAMYYVPGLQTFSSPFYCWAGILALGGVAAWHGSVKDSLITRGTTSTYTLLVTAQALYMMVMNPGTVHLFGHDLRVAAIGCVVGVIFCGGMSVFYKKTELKHAKWQESADYNEWATGALYWLSHEAYFLGAVVSAMALPLYLASLSEAPIYWALFAPALLGISWRNGNVIKHALVVLMWAAAALLLMYLPFGTTMPWDSIAAVTVSALGMGSAYRYLPSTLAKEPKQWGYAVYVYGAMSFALYVPLHFFGNVWECTNWWMAEGLVLCLLGIGLRDSTMHKIGAFASIAGVALFMAHYQTWTWAMVGPVVGLIYALSVAYAYIHKWNGWKQDEFLPFGGEYTVSADHAFLLERLWSWVGFAMLVGASFLLVAHEQTVLWWSGEALVLFVLGFAAERIGYRLQGLIVIWAATLKLACWDVTGGTFAWSPDAAITYFRALEFAVVGTSALLASFLYYWYELKLIAAANPPATPPTGGPSGGQVDPNAPAGTPSVPSIAPGAIDPKDTAHDDDADKPKG